ncbi:hypothetical protein FDP41_012541 [Naegleria fowleri]|uniref:Uncharacterized protein n=1 Tax=Naegleria fowleri TaxID=5763 RepID=A0A6A5C2M6_NAEFO|nr:uncharacterized protein FDP41_012541 [Naegleria fowleri]KAF0981281.1 hypothetical protein FDP41_012541 [Naegleria fowleri]CAG4708744.1 unnamed protein product [Naegleria fowleri]
MIHHHRPRGPEILNFETNLSSHMSSSASGVFSSSFTTRSSSQQHYISQESANNDSTTLQQHEVTNHTSSITISESHLKAGMALLLGFMCGVHEDLHQAAKTILLKHHPMCQQKQQQFISDHDASVSENSLQMEKNQTSKTRMMNSYHQDHLKKNCKLVVVDGEKGNSELPAVDIMTRSKQRVELAQHQEQLLKEFQQQPQQQQTKKGRISISIKELLN